MAADLEMVRRLSKADQGLAIVAVARGDGSVHASLVNAGVFEFAGGAPGVAFVVAGGSKKLDHFARQGRATIAFRSGWEWVSVEGAVRIIGAEYADLPALLRAVFVAAGGTHDDWDTFDRVMAEERRVAVLLTPERIVSNR